VKERGAFAAGVLLVGRGRSPASCKARGGSLVSQTDAGSGVWRASASSRATVVLVPEVPEGDKKGYCSSEAADLFFFFPPPKK